MIAEVHIQTALRGNITFLKKAYYTQPFKIANITEDKKEATLRLMLTSASPGILDGDKYRMKIEVQNNCSLDLTTQSYQRLFRMKNGASQDMEVHLAEGSSFSYLPHPVVPHGSSSFTGHNTIFLSGGCRLIWGEILTCGRKLSGEAFLFSRYHSVTEIFLAGKLIIKENLLLRPLVAEVSAIGQLEGYTHQATLIYLHETAPVKILMSGINDYLSAQKGITFGITAAQKNGCIIRILGFKAEQLSGILKTISANYLDKDTFAHAG